MMASIKFSSIFEVVAVSGDEALSLKAQAELIGAIRDIWQLEVFGHISRSVPRETEL